MTRRTFLSLLAFLALPLSIKAAAEEPAAVDGNERAEALRLFVDTLIPADDLTPAASDIGVVDALLEKAVSNANLQTVITQGGRWLQTAPSIPLTEMNPEQRISLLKWMSESPQSDFPYRFFAYIRYEAMGLYYSHKESWTGSGVSTPPQPAGFNHIVRPSTHKGA